MKDILATLIHKLPPSVRRPPLRAVGRILDYIGDGSIQAPDGHVFNVSPQMDPTTFLSIRMGHYEKSEIAILRGYFKPEPGTIVEIGANIGVVARYAFSEKLANGGKYICVEPNPDAIEALKSNMVRAQGAFPDRQVDIIQAAISHQENPGAEFLVRPNLTSGLVGQLKASAHETTTHVKTITLSTLLKPLRGSMSLVCDAEGAEIDMITKEGDAMRRFRQVAIELHEPSLTGRPEKPHDMLHALNKLGFRVHGKAENTYYLSRE